VSREALKVFLTEIQVLERNHCVDSIPREMIACLKKCVLTHKPDIRIGQATARSGTRGRWPGYL
jgi:hypothetical protein